MGAVVRPSERVGARRRRLILWLPLLIAGVLFSGAGGPMITIFNSLDLIGAALMLGALVGFVKEMDK